MPALFQSAGRQLVVTRSTEAGVRMPGSGPNPAVMRVGIECLPSWTSLLHIYKTGVTGETNRQSGGVD